MVTGSSIAKLRQASHFVQVLQRAGRAAAAQMAVPIVRNNCLLLTLNGLDVTIGAASYCSMGQFFPSGRCEHCSGLVVPVDGKCPGAIRCLECDPVDPLRLPWTAAWLASELRPPK
jgi:hypothetical protein